MSLRESLIQDVSTWFQPPTTEVEHNPDLDELLARPHLQWIIEKIYGANSKLDVVQHYRLTHAAPNPASIFKQFARLYGVPDDALKRFLAADYVPQPKQLEFHGVARLCDLPDGPTRIGIGGARGGAKSHGALAQIVIDDCQRMRGLKFLFLRKVLKAARESFDDLRRKVLMGVEHEYARTEGLLVVTSTDSRVVLGHYRNESDIDGYLGIEYDGVCVEESTQLSETKRKDISSCVRTSKPGWRPREYDTTNPGGIGHQWFKRDFVEPQRKVAETDTRFIPSTHRDNVFLNPEYGKILDKLPGWKRRAWRDGDWEIAAGQYFTNWHYDSHVIKPFPVPIHWPAWATLDYGFTHPTAVYLLREFDGDIYVTAEHVESKLLPGQHAPLIKEKFIGQGLDVKRVRPFVAGADAFDNKGDEHGKTIAQQYEQHGIHLERANMSRISRAGELLERLGDVHSKKVIRPTIKIFSTCTRLIECVPALQHDPHRPEDVLKWDIDEDGNGGDDPYDALGMGLLVKRIVRVKPAIAGARQAGGFRMV